MVWKTGRNYRPSKPAGAWEWSQSATARPSSTAAATGSRSSRASSHRAVAWPASNAASRASANRWPPPGRTGTGRAGETTAGEAVGRDIRIASSNRVKTGRNRIKTGSNRSNSTHAGQLRQVAGNSAVRSRFQGRLEAVSTLFRRGFSVTPMVYTRGVIVVRWWYWHCALRRVPLEGGVAPASGKRVVTLGGARG